MKPIVFASLILLLIGLSFNAKAQTPSSPDLPENISDYQTTKPMVVNSYQQPYIIKDKKLATFFKSGTIPASFPKYNYDLTKKENKTLIKEWYHNGDNKELLSPIGREKVAELENKSAK